MEPTLNSDHQPHRKKPRGRQKIEIKKVEKDSNRSVCFSHRKSGIFRKATEISTLCDAEIAVIIFSQHNKVFSYGEVDKLLDRYLGTHEVGNNGSSSSQSESNKSQTTTTVQEHEYWKAVAMKEELKRELKMAESNRNLMKNNGEGFWWESDIETIEKEELEGFKKSLEEFEEECSESDSRNFSF